MSFTASFGIWWKAIILNALIISLWMFFYIGPMAVALALGLMVGGFICTLPLIPVIVLFFYLQHSLRCYPPPARITWFSFMLLLLVWGFYYALVLIFNGGLLNEGSFYYAVCVSTSLAVLIAIRIDKKSFPAFTISNEETFSPSENMSHV